MAYCNKYPLYRAIGLALKQIRNKQGISLRQLSKLSGVSHSYFAKIENYERRVTFSEIEDFANWIGYSIEDVIKLAREIESSC